MVLCVGGGLGFVPVRVPHGSCLLVVALVLFCSIVALGPSVQPNEGGLGSQTGLQFRAATSMLGLVVWSCSRVTTVFV